MLANDGLCRNIDNRNQNSRIIPEAVNQDKKDANVSKNVDVETIFAINLSMNRVKHSF